MSESVAGDLCISQVERDNVLQLCHMHQAADELGVPVIATGLVSSLYRTLQAEGLGGEGNHALVKALERLSGVEVGAAPSSADEGT